MDHILDGQQAPEEERKEQGYDRGQDFGFEPGGGRQKAALDEESDAEEEADPGRELARLQFAIRAVENIPSSFCHFFRSWPPPF